MTRLYVSATSLFFSIFLGTASASLQLTPIDPKEWDYQKAAHLIERAGFGATPAQIKRIAQLTPKEAVRSIVYFEGLQNLELPPFEHSGVFEPGLDPFPPSRPATTNLATQTGEALGIKVKTSGNRPLQPVVNKFFYWLRASRLETDRVAYWWAQRMLVSNRPLQEKMALFWHGHFATNEDKVRDYRKMLKQLQLFQSQGLSDFRTLLLSVAQDPAMLVFLDAGVNVKGSPNENFAREVMELFSMGVGNYSEQDIREAARAFTGWNYQGLDFVINPEQHDDDEKEFLGEKGNFDGIDIIDKIIDQPVTAEFIASKLYKFFVSEELTVEGKKQLGHLLRDNNYRFQPFLETLFASKEFYEPKNTGTRVKSPVELVISTYRKLGLEDLPGAPDFNLLTEALGQRLMHPPTVAGWSYGRSWITPSLLIERGNFALDLVFPDIGFIPKDRYPIYGSGSEILAVHRRLRAGENMASATRPADMESYSEMDESMMTAASSLVNREEAFNTRYGSYRGWQMAIERVKPIERDIARLDLTSMVMSNELATPLDVVNYFSDRFLTVNLDDTTKILLAKAFETELGTSDVLASRSVLEEPLRILLHLVLSRPEYQLG